LASTYTALCLAALGVILLALLQRGFGSWSLFPVLVGALGLIIRWRSAPQLLLLALAGFLAVHAMVRPAGRVGFFRQPRYPVGDFVLCGAVLGYVAAHYRLQSLQDAILPPDPRRREPPSGKPGRFLRLAPKVIQQRRSERQASPWEAVRLVLALPAWAAAAQVCWWLMPDEWDYLDLPRWFGQALVLAWLLGLVLVIGASALSYLGWRGWRPEEAGLYLQDVLWQETRREQRRLNRWMAWGRLRDPRGKETP
jgi:hypothetical protein